MDYLSGQFFLSLTALALVVVYIGLTLYLVRKKPSALWIPVVVVVLLATLVYWDAYKAGGAFDWFPRAILSVYSALNLFIFNEFSNSGKLASVFYGEDWMSPEQILAARERLVFLQALFFCAIWTTSILIIHFFARRLSSKVWLRTHRPSGKPIHVFWGADKNSLSLAADLSRDKDNQIIFVAFPRLGDISSKLSISQFFKGFKDGADQRQAIVSVVPSATVLSAKTDFAHYQDGDLLKALGLPGLLRWMNRTESKVYFLSGMQEEVVTLLQTLPSMQSDLYFYADKRGLNSRVELSSNKKIHFLDEAQLTEKQLKLTPELYPVHFADRALNGEGEPLGWVKTPFNALILGYGGVGKGVLSFLYEYAAFVGEDKHALPFTCDVLDQDATRMGGDFRVQHPGIPEGEIRFRDIEVGTEPFWTFFEGTVSSLDYISVDLGDDDVNARVALDILDVLSRHKQSSQPALLVKLEYDDKYKDLFDFYATSLGMNSLFFIGNHDQMWTAANIFNDTLEPFAKLFYQAYSAATGSDESWESRNEAIWKKDTSELWKRQEYLRKTEMDCGNYLHRKEKACLAPKRFIDDPTISDSIPSAYTGQHCVGLSEKDCSILEYLSIGEHIHWMAAHHIRGYKLGSVKREDIKEHTDLVDYFQLSENVRHYDWIMIKTTLAMLRKERNT
ncbi:MAG: hypothetical protein K6D54_07645 [Bacteroidales bacterium]|nr:hypothetical protein [Bacteroidales bacterium]